MSRNRVNRTGKQGHPAATVEATRSAHAHEPTPPVHAWWDPRQFGWMGYLLVAVPVAIAASLLHAPAVVKFIAAGVAIIPLAGVMEPGDRTALPTGSALRDRRALNATFGNAGGADPRGSSPCREAPWSSTRWYQGVAHRGASSATSSLLVLGASLFAGGLKFSIQRFNRTAAGAGSTMMVLATVGMIVPALFHNLVPNAGGLEHKVSVAVCVLLVFTYGLSLLFSLVTHRELISGLKEDVAAAISEATWGLRHATALLIGATVFVAWMSEILVSAVEPAGEEMGLSGVFMGVFVVAIVGNAAEHSTAIIMALKNQMDLAVGIALGSALQVALFVAPVLVLRQPSPGGRRWTCSSRPSRSSP